MFKVICRKIVIVSTVLFCILFSSKDLYAQATPKWTGYAKFTSISKDENGYRTWIMEAHLDNDTGTATHTMKWAVYGDLPDEGTCSGSYKTSMSGGYGEGSKLYDFWIPIPACTGSSKRGVWKGEEETAITVEGQTGENPNVMKGRIVEKSEGKVMTWEWNFVKSRKRN